MRSPFFPLQQYSNNSNSNDSKNSNHKGNTSNSNASHNSNNHNSHFCLDCWLLATAQLFSLSSFGRLISTPFLEVLFRVRPYESRPADDILVGAIRCRLGSLKKQLEMQHVGHVGKYGHPRLQALQPVESQPDPERIELHASILNFTPRPWLLMFLTRSVLKPKTAEPLIL